MLGVSMAKIVVECSDPNDLDAIEAASEQFVGRCNITYFKQAQAMQDVGSAKSQREAAKKIADETGETFNAVHHRVKRGAKEMGQGGPPEENIIKSTVKPELEKLEKPEHGGARKNSGRKPKEVNNVVTNAMEFSTIAISQLERIRSDDPKRIDALNRVALWIANNR